MKNLINIDEAAKMLNITPHTLRDYDNRGIINSIRTLGNQRTFKLEDIESYLSGNRSNVIDVREYNQIYSEHFVKNENRTDKILSLCKHRNNTLILKYINFISNNIERCNTKHYTIDISNLNLWELNSGYSIIQLLIEGIPKFIEHCIIN